MRRMYLLLLVPCCLLMTVCSLFGQISQEMSFQGKLTGEPAGFHTLEFFIYNSESGGTSLWNELHPFVLVDEDGMFNVKMGETTPIDLDFTEDYWVEVSVNGVPLTSRYKLTSGAYSFHSAYSDTAGYAHSGSGGSAPGGSDGDVQFNNLGIFDGSNQLNWDIANQRLGIGAPPTSAAKLEIITGTDAGIHIHGSNSNNGIVIDSTGFESIVIEYSGSDGMFIEKPADNGITINEPSDNGISIMHPHQIGVEITYADSFGVYIDDPVVTGIYINEPGGNGVHVNMPLEAGIEINNPGIHGIDICGSIETKSGIYIHDCIGSGDPDTGIVIRFVGQDGIVIDEPGDDGIFVLNPGDDGIHVASAGDDGVYIVSPDSDGISINSPGSDGIEVSIPEVYGLRVRAGTNTNAGISIYDATGTGDPDTGIVIRNVTDCGIFIDTVTCFGIKIRHPGCDGIYIYEPQADGISMYGSVYHGVSIANTGTHGISATDLGECGLYIVNTGNHGIWVEGARWDGMYILEPDSSGIYIDGTGKDGLFVRWPADDGVDVVDPGGNCFECNGSPVTLFRVSNSCEVYSHSFNQYIVDSDGIGYTAPMSATTQRWLEHIGEGEIAGGQCRIELPGGFLESVTIDAQKPLEVFITPYGEIGKYWVERNGTNFIVHGDADVQFAYKVHARIRGFEDAKIAPVDLTELDDDGEVRNKQDR